MKPIVSNGVFEREGHDTVSPSFFYFILMLSVIWGLGATGYAAQYANEIEYMPKTIWELLSIGLLIPILGIVIALKSDEAIVSFIGYNLVVFPFGFLLGPVLQEYNADVVRNACYLTGTITIVMGFTGVLFPRVYENMGGGLFIALTGLVIVRILQIFIPAMQSWGWIEYLSAGIFSLYIGYDMYRASVIGKTIDNAIDVSVSLYLDIINLFLNILRILGSKK